MGEYIVHVNGLSLPCTCLAFVESGHSKMSMYQAPCTSYPENQSPGPPISQKASATANRVSSTPKVLTYAPA